MPKTALLLTGGGARGIIQYGMLKALEQLKVPYDGIFSCSVGALNAAMVQAKALKELEQIWLIITRKDIFNYAPWHALARKASFLDHKPLQELLSDYITPQKWAAIYNSKPDFVISITNCIFAQPYLYRPKNNRPEDLDKFLKALLASCSVPIAFPHHTNGLIDGGITNNFAIGTAVNEGYDQLIVLCPTRFTYNAPKNIIDMIGILLGIAEWAQLERELKFVEKLNNVPGFKKIEVILVQPREVTSLQLLDFDMKGFNRQNLISIGYKQAMIKLKDLRI